MFTLLFPIAFLASAGLIDGAAVGNRNTSIRLGTNLFKRQDEESCLDGSLIQSASALTGQEPGTKGIKPGQAESAT